MLKRRQEGQPPDAVAHSWKAQHRLHKVFKRLAFRKNNQIAAVAVARELAGFVWVLMPESAVEDRSRAASSLRALGSSLAGNRLSAWTHLSFDKTPG